MCVPVMDNHIYDTQKSEITIYAGIKVDKTLNSEFYISISV